MGLAGDTKKVLKMGIIRVNNTSHEEDVEVTTIDRYGKAAQKKTLQKRKFVGNSHDQIQADTFAVWEKETLEIKIK